MPGPALPPDEHGGATRARDATGPGTAQPYLAAVLESMSDGFVALDRAWRYVYVNARAAQLLGRAPGTLEGTHIWTEFPEGADQPFARAYERVMATGVPETIEGLYQPWNRWFENRIRATPDGIAILFADVTERHRSAERLERAAQDFAALAEHAPDSVVRVGPDRAYLYANPATAALLGVPVERVIGARVGDLVERRQVSTAWSRALDECFARAEPRATTFPVQLSGEDERWFESRFVPEREEGSGAVASVLVVTREVTEQRRAAVGLERLAALVQSSEDAIVGLTLAGEVTSWNPAAERMFGYAAAEAIGASTDLVLAPHARAEGAALRARVARGEAVSHSNLWHVTRDGRELPIAVTMAPVRDADGTVVGISAIKRDMSAQHLLEAQLREAQKMEAIGRLAGGVAHDFNNLLTAILASAELGLADPALPESGELRADLAEIRSAAMRAAELTKQLLAFSRRQELQPQRLDVNEVIANAERLLRRAVGDGAEMRTTLGDDVPPVVADRGQLEQVLLNLALNARDAMQDRTHGALLAIETSAVTVGRVGGGTVPPGVALAPGRWAVIVVRDTGVGMDAAVAARVFEPFFTTKEVGKGTGLGLAMVYGIVTQSGGHITAEGVPGVGSTFTIYLPAAPAAPERTPTLRDRPPTP